VKQSREEIILSKTKTNDTKESKKHVDQFMDTIRNLSKYHREHEKFYAKQPLEQAIEIQDFSLALKTLADEWSEIEPKKSVGKNPFMGAEDVNEDSTIQYNGILFMEGEGEPIEIKRFIRDAKTLAEDFKQTGIWLSNAMQKSWDTAKPLIKIPIFASVLGERHRIIINDWQAAQQSKLIGSLIMKATEILEKIDLSLDSVREDLAGLRCYPDYLYSSAELLDRAADLASESAILVHDNERRWRVFRKKILELQKNKPFED
jgi:hypothetical protein